MPLIVAPPPLCSFSFHAHHTEEAPPPPASGEAAPAAAGPSTPRRLSHLGTTYIRTKTGNLVSLAFARKQKHLADHAHRAQQQLDQKKRDSLQHLGGVVQGVQGARNSAAARRGRRGCVSCFFPPPRFEDPHALHSLVMQQRTRKGRNVPETSETEIRQAVPLLPANRCV